MRRGRAALFFLLVLGGAGVGGFFYAKKRVLVAIEKRCEAACSCTCAVDDVVVHTDGASAEGVHLKAKLGLVSGDVSEIRARFDWPSAMLGRAQGVSVDVVKPVLNNELPVGDFAMQLRRMGNGELPDGTPGNLTLERLVVADGEVSAKVSLLSEIRVQGITVDWSPKGTFELHWRDASFDAILTKKGTGPCAITMPKGSSKATIDCGSVKTQLDVTKVKSLAELAKLFLKVDLP